MPETNDPGPSLDQRKRVQAKEEVRKYGKKALLEITKQIRNASISSSELDVNAWRSVFLKMENDVKDFEYLVGVAGDSGLGKSSLVNALLGLESDIAPTSQSGACTAAVCCFRHSDGTDTDAKFSANIQMKSRETVDSELISFFQEYKELEERASGEGIDQVVQGERKAFIDKIKLIQSWSGLEENDIRELGLNDAAFQITERCENREKLFGNQPGTSTIHHIFSSTAAEFLRSIKPYSGSGGKQRHRQLWPLVEIIHFYLDAPLLRDGIVLVDLPGETDALESRSKIARDYYRRIDQMMIVAPHDRAADNKTAVELLREDQIVDMEADSKTDKFAVVITKTDQLDWKAFVENEWSAEDISPDFPQLHSQFKRKKRQLARVASALRALNANGSDDADDSVSDSGSDDEVKDPRARELGLPPLDDQDVGMLQQMQNRLQHEKDVLDTMCFAACMEARSGADKEKFLDFINETRGRLWTGTDEPLPPIQMSIFPVSSKAQRLLLKGKPLSEFRDERTTGFRDLADWIVNGSLRSREEHADNIICQCAILFDTLQAWVEDGQELTVKLPSSEFEKIEKVLQAELESLKAQFKRSNARLKMHFSSINPLSKRGDTSKRLDADFQGHVRQFSTVVHSGERIHWSTYAALVRRCGGAFRTVSKPRMVHDWQSRTYSYFWTKHTRAWTRVHHKVVPDYVEGLRKKEQDLVRWHIQSILKPKKLPQEYKDQFQASTHYKIENLIYTHRNGLNKLKRAYLKKAARSKADSRVLINTILKNGYREAQDIRGKGMHERQVATMIKFAGENHQQKFEEIEETIERQLGEARKEAVGEHRHLCSQTCAAIGKLELFLAKRICSRAAHGQPEPSSGHDTQQLKDHIKSKIASWVRKRRFLTEKYPGFEARPLSEETQAEFEQADREAEQERLISKKRKSRKAAGALAPNKGLQHNPAETGPVVKEEEQPAKLRKVVHEPQDQEMNWEQ